VGQVRTDRHLDPVRAAVTPSGRWRLAYPLAVSLVGAGLLLAAALLLGLAPAVVVTAERRLALTPLLLLPVAAVHLAARAALRAEREREQAERERARAQAAAEAMLATVSHELRAPLTVVLGSLDTLTTRDAALEPEQRRELVAMAARQGERLKRLVEQLLEAARLEQAELGPARGSVIDAVKVAREAERAAELCHPSRHVHLDAGRALPVRAASETLLQVLTNLLDNAAKYSPAGTPIRLQARRQGGQAVIAVIDAGPGVPAGQRERIFERFTQLESSDGRRGEGAGLGLYIARKLARSLGGDLVLCKTRPPARGAFRAAPAAGRRGASAGRRARSRRRAVASGWWPAGRRPGHAYDGRLRDRG
jgi:signal transduction histidine kinase